MPKDRTPSKSSSPDRKQGVFALDRARLSGTLWIARAGLLLAGGVAAYLLWHALTHDRIGGCGPGSPCDRVLGSHWAYLGPVPVSALALLAYGILLITTFQLALPQTPRFRAKPWLLTVLLSSALITAALWFLALQLVHIGALCKFCVAAHAGAVVAGIACLAVARRCLASANPASKPQFCLKPSAAIAASLAGAACVAVLASAQITFPHRMNLVRVHKGTFKLDLRELPKLGSESATRVFVSLFDYTCPDCRDMHKLLASALKRYGTQLAIVSLPVPLDARCNPVVRTTQKKHQQACDYAKLGLALRRVSNAAFLQFDEWIFEPRDIPTLDQAREKARQIVGEEPLKAALSDPWVERTLQTSVALYEQNGNITSSYRMPQLVIGDIVNLGRLTRPEDLYQLLEKNLGVTPPP